MYKFGRGVRVFGTTARVVRGRHSVGCLCDMRFCAPLCLQPRELCGATLERLLFCVFLRRGTRACERFLCEMAEPLVKTRARLVADPSIGVADLAQAWQKFLSVAELQRKLNLFDFVSPPNNVGWKSTPHAGYLVRLAPLLQQLLSVAGNGVLPGKRHKAAIASLAEQDLISVPKPRSREDFVDFLDDRVRMALSQLRTLKASDLCRQRTFRKVDQNQQDTLCDLMGRLSLPLLADGEAAQTAAAEDPDSQVNCTAMVVREEDNILQVVPKDQQVSQHSLEKSLDAAAIFQMVLSKPEYVPAEERLPAAEPLGSPPGKSQKRPSKAAASPPKGFLGGLMRSGAFDDLDVATLKELEDQEPPPSAFKSTTKSNAKSKKPTGGKGKGKKASKKQRSEQTLDEEAEDVPETPAKRKAATEKAADCEDISRSNRETPPKPTGPSRKKKTDEDIARMPLKDRKKLLSSRAYHKTLDQGLRNGMTSEAAKVAARQASQKVLTQMSQAPEEQM